MSTVTLKTTTPQELERLRRLGENVELIDVRMPREYRELHVEYARNIPLDRLDPKEVMDARQGAPDQMLYIICRSGKRGEQACQKFVQAGFLNVVNVEGGTLACETAGLPVVRGKRAVSLDRQVRTVAGTLVLTGAVLGYFVHPYFIALTGLVGAGLIFSGVTDKCPMTQWLARMPWNQVADQKPACGCGG